MDARDETTVPGETAVEPDLEAVKALYARIARDGVLEGVTHLLTFCHDDVELRGYSVRAAGAVTGAQTEVLYGKDAVLDFFRRGQETGVSINVRTRGFEVEGDTVAVRGSTRVNRPDGSFAETSLTWRYHFRDGLVASISWEPRAG